MMNATFDQMITIIRLAEQRIIYVISFKIAKIRLERAWVANDDQEAVDDLTQKCAELLATIHEIDDCFAEYYISTGRLN